MLKTENIMNYRPIYSYNLFIQQLYNKPFLNILKHRTSSMNFGVEMRFRCASRFGSFKNLGNHSKPIEIQNCDGLFTLPA